MKSIAITCIIALACNVLTSACTAETPGDAIDQHPADVAKIGAVEKVPQELRLAPTPHAICTRDGQRLIQSFGIMGGSSACIVTVICHDFSEGCIPTFCGNGQCSGNAPTLAAGMCTLGCNAANCGNMKQLGQGC